MHPAFSGSFYPLENDSLFRHGRACPGHPRLSCLVAAKTWMPGTRPGMTSFARKPYSIGCISVRFRGARVSARLEGWAAGLMVRDARLRGLLTMRVSLALRSDLPAMANQIRAFGLRQINPTGKSLLIFRNRVKPRNQKYSAFAVWQISARTSAILSQKRGVAH